MEERVKSGIPKDRYPHDKAQIFLGAYGLHRHFIFISFLHIEVALSYV